MIIQNKFDIGMEYDLPSAVIEDLVQRQTEELFSAVAEKIKPEYEYRIKYRKAWYEDPGRYKKGYKMAVSIEELKTKTVKYFDEDEMVWKIGEVIVDE